MEEIFNIYLAELAFPWLVLLFSDDSLYPVLCGQELVEKTKQDGSVVTSKALTPGYSPGGWPLCTGVKQLSHDWEQR